MRLLRRAARQPQPQRRMARIAGSVSRDSYRARTSMAAVVLTSFRLADMARER